MLYIKKGVVPQNVKSQIARIKSTPEWRALEDTDKGVRDHFDRLSKAEIREALLKEQHGLCAYCMKRIRNEELHMTIEHWAPLSKHKEQALDYHNFLGVCKGGADVETKGKRILCCDAHKSDEDQMVIDPRDQRMMNQIAYQKDGTVYFENSEGWDKGIVSRIEKDINETLRLNGERIQKGGIIDTSTMLLKGRKDAVRQAEIVIKKLARKDKLTSTNIMKFIESLQSKSEYPEFAGTIIFFLNRKYKRLLSQEK